MVTSQALDLTIYWFFCFAFELDCGTKFKMAERSGRSF